MESSCVGYSVKQELNRKYRLRDLHKFQITDNFINAEPATDDFVEAVLGARNNSVNDSPRVSL